MAEYIDQQGAEKFIEDGLNNPDETKRFGHDAIEIMAEVHYMDAADVVAVVRCRDCKHYDRDECYHPRHEKHQQSIPQSPDDFCSYGERREAKT